MSDEYKRYNDTFLENKDYRFSLFCLPEMRGIAHVNMSRFTRQSLIAKIFGVPRAASYHPCAYLHVDSDNKIRLALDENAPAEFTSEIQELAKKAFAQKLNGKSKH